MKDARQQCQQQTHRPSVVGIFASGPLAAEQIAAGAAAASILLPLPPVPLFFSFVVPA